MGEVLKEAKRLYDLGFAVIWLCPRSKVPLEPGWTTGERQKWSYLESTYRKGFNVGVRLGSPSVLNGRYLAVVDVDVKSRDRRHLREAMGAVKRIIHPADYPMVRTGRGMGSRHYYCSSTRPFKTYTPARSEETIRAFIPSKDPSKRDRAQLSAKEIKAGWRISAAWEVSLYSDGRQVVLPPSIHPDSGERYTWERPLDPGTLPLFTPKAAPSEGTSEGAAPTTLEDFEVSPVELAWLPISDKMRRAIMVGEGVKNRSDFLMNASSALFAIGLSRNEVLTVLTDRKTFMGECAYEHAKTNSRKRAAQWLQRYTVKKVDSERASVDVFKEPPPPSRKLTPEEMEDQTKEMKADRPWSQDFIKSKNGGISSNLLQNTILVLENVVPKGALRRDEFAYRDAYSVDTPWGGKAGKHVEDDDVPKIKYWIGQKFGFEPSSNAISDGLIVVATQNSFDPVKDFLNDGLPFWDGKPRLDGWLRDHFEAKGDPEYLAQVFRKWMVAMVMRAYQPGTKFDWMPIFEGKQDMGKSSFGRILVGDKYFTDWLPPLSDKDAALALQGIWGAEFGELSQFRRNELETIKGFITRTVDKIRPPYGRRIVESARRCVFFGTTNRETYLIDETGNRRFKPIVVGRLNFKQLRRDRLQLFAEAKHLWDDGVETEISLGRLTEGARAFETKIHGEKMVADDSDAMLEIMIDFMRKVERKEVKFDLQKFRSMDLFSGAGCLARWQTNSRNFQFAAKMLKKLGAEKKKVHGQRYWDLTGGQTFEEGSAPTPKGGFTDDSGEE